MLKRRIRVLLFILLLVISCSVSFAAEKRKAKVVELHGTVEVQTATSEKKIPAFKNMVINEGDKIITGKDSKIVMTVDKDKEVTLASNTIAILSELKGNSASGDTVIMIQAGGVGSKIENKLDKDSSYRIKTPTAVMGVRGTQFYVQVEKPEKNLSHPKVNIWISKGTIEVEYRQEDSNISKYTENKGKLESFVMTAPKKFDFPSEGKVPMKQEDFELKGLRKEFIDYKELSDLYDEDEIEKERKRAEADEKEADNDEPHEVHVNPSYKEIENGVHNNNSNNNNDDGGGDKHGGTNAAGIPPRPGDGYVYVGNYTFNVVDHVLAPRTITATLGRWVVYHNDGNGNGRIYMKNTTAHPDISNDAVYVFDISDAERNNYVLGDIDLR